MKKVAYNAGVWKKKDLDKDYLNINEHLYVAPTENGAYTGIKKPDKSGDEIIALLEIHYSNPNFFRDYINNSTEIGQEGLWVGKRLRLKKIKDIPDKIPKRIWGRNRGALRYRRIVVEVDEENSERTPTNEEYLAAQKEFLNKYNKQCSPDSSSPEEKKFFYDSIERKVKENNSTPNLGIKEEPKTLEKLLRNYIITISFITGIFLLSPNITGNVIGNPSIKSNSIIGFILLVISILVFTFSLRKKNTKINLPKDKHRH